MVAHLARCQVDPAAPRSSIETLLHAFVPAPHVHHTHPDGINVLAGTRDGERLVAECFGDEAAWIPYIRPGFTLAKQVGTRGAREPGPQARRARQARPRGVGRQRRGGVPAHDRGHQPRGRVRQRADAAGAQRFDGPAGDGLADARRGELLREVLPALRGAVSSERAKVLVVDTSPRARRVRLLARGARAGRPWAPRAPTTSCTPSACRCGSRYDPAADDAETLAARIRERAAAFRDDYRAYVAAYGDDSTVPADPDARVVLIQHVGLVGVAPTTKGAAAVARPLPPRDRGDGRRARARRLRVARRGGELRDRVLAARALQALAGPAARRARRARWRWSPARPAASAAPSSSRSPRPAPASSRSTSTRRAPRRPSRSWATPASPRPAT